MPDARNLSLSNVISCSGEYGAAVCLLPSCGQALHVTMHGTMGLYEDSPETPEFSDMNTWTWEVVCEGGHTICVPPDDAGDTPQPFKLSEFLRQGFISWPEESDD